MTDVQHLQLVKALCQVLPLVKFALLKEANPHPSNVAIQCDFHVGRSALQVVQPRHSAAEADKCILRHSASFSHKYRQL